MDEDKATHANYQALFDTSAGMHYSIQWKVKIDSGKNNLITIAYFFRKSHG
jgi:hypothetical protein